MIFLLKAYFHFQLKFGDTVTKHYNVFVWQQKQDYVFLPHYKFYSQVQFFIFDNHTHFLVSVYHLVLVLANLFGTLFSEKLLFLLVKFSLGSGNSFPWKLFSISRVSKQCCNNNLLPFLFPNVLLTLVLYVLLGQWKWFLYVVTLVSNYCSLKIFFPESNLLIVLDLFLSHKWSSPSLQVLLSDLTDCSLSFVLTFSTCSFIELLS